MTITPSSPSIRTTSTIAKNVLARAETWPEEDQDELIERALEIEARRHGVYDLTPEELRAIKQALAAVGREGIASVDQVEAIFARYQRLTNGDRKAIEEGLEDVRHGRFATDQEIQDLVKKAHLQRD